jgi:hypothetical protein
MKWINTKDELPPHAKVVLGWGRLWDSDIRGFYLCGLDYETGWLQWPDLSGLEISHWCLILGPDNEKEWIYEGVGDEMDKS